jgi:hypothetical protein
MFIHKKIRKFVAAELKVVMQASRVFSLWINSSLIKTVMTIYASVSGYFSISLSLWSSLFNTVECKFSLHSSDSKKKGHYQNLPHPHDKKLFGIQCTTTQFQHHKSACPSYLSHENVIMTQNQVPNNWHYIVTRFINPFTRNLGNVTASNTYCLSRKGQGNITRKSLSHTP